MNIFKKLFTKQVNSDISQNQLPYFKYIHEPPERLRQSYEIGEVKEENGVVFYWNGHNWVTCESNHHEIDGNSTEYTFEMARQLNAYSYELAKIVRMNTSELCSLSQIDVLKDFAEKLGLTQASTLLHHLIQIEKPIPPNSQLIKEGQEPISFINGTESILMNIKITDEQIDDFTDEFVKELQVDNKSKRNISFGFQEGMCKMRELTQK